MLFSRTMPSESIPPVRDSSVRGMFLKEGILVSGSNKLRVSLLRHGAIHYDSLLTSPIPEDPISNSLSLGRLIIGSSTM